MPDISKCNNEECLARNMCYRYTAEPSEYQWYSDYQPKDGEEKCEHFWPLNNDNEKENKRRAWHY
jgi:hypothetical protein